MVIRMKIMIRMTRVIIMVDLKMMNVSLKLNKNFCTKPLSGNFAYFVDFTYFMQIAVYANANAW